MIISKLVDSFRRAFRGTGVLALVPTQDRQGFVTTQQEEMVGLTTPLLVVTHTHVSNEEEHWYHKQQYQYTNSDERQLESAGLGLLQEKRSWL